MMRPLIATEPIIVVVGPTASGKSDLAQDLALKNNGEIINADSQQFYTGFDIGTGKVLKKDQKVPHYLLDVCKPGRVMTAIGFAKFADEVIHNISNKRKIPIVVGGTGLYIKALLEGFDELPERDLKVRGALKLAFEKDGGKSLHEKLSSIDPQSAAHISPQDSSRLIRYLEIYEITGKAPSALMQSSTSESLRYIAQTIWINPERISLRAKIASRVRSMMDLGWLEEVKGLMARGLDPRGLENKPIGYSELADVVNGKMDLATGIEQIILRTSQYAKRQETFFKKMLANPAYQMSGSSLDVRDGHP